MPGHLLLVVSSTVEARGRRAGPSRLDHPYSGDCVIRGIKAEIVPMHELPFIYAPNKAFFAYLFPCMVCKQTEVHALV